MGFGLCRRVRRHVCTESNEGSGGLCLESLVDISMSPEIALEAVSESEGLEKEGLEQGK